MIANVHRFRGGAGPTTPELLTDRNAITDMPNWIVAAHGWGEKKTSRIRRVFAPTEKFEYGVTMIPLGLELVMFTHQNAIMGMDLGWDFWDALTRGMHGGELGAYRRRHKSKTAGSIVPDYRTRGDTTFPTGVFEVCTNGAPNKVITIDPGDMVPLSDILSQARRSKTVERIYWGCCTQLDATAPMVNPRW